MGSEFEINGVTYRTGKLDAFQQLYIVRRLAPSIGKLLNAVEGMVGRPEGGGDLKSLMTASSSLLAEGGTDGLGAFAEAITEAIYTLTDKDMEFVITTCLKTVRRKDGTNNKWVQVIREGSLMFEDLDLITMIRIVVEVIKDNLSAFSGSLPSGFTDLMTAAQNRMSNG